jgi:F0F1-type ATP synthase membrane subunit b/b'
VFGVEVRAMERIAAVVDAFRETQRANAAYTKARDALDAYLTEHPDIRREADVMVSNAIAEASTGHLARA